MEPWPSRGFIQQNYELVHTGGVRFAWPEDGTDTFQGARHAFPWRRDALCGRSARTPELAM